MIFFQQKQSLLRIQWPQVDMILLLRGLNLTCFILISSGHNKLTFIQNSESLVILRFEMKRTKSQHQRDRHNKTNERLLKIRAIESYRPERYALPEGYYSSPTPQQIFAHNGKCSQIVIGNRHGRAHWTGSIDISQLAAPLSSTIMIGNAQIEVYLADKAKPSIGKELNKPCQVTFFTDVPHDARELKQICKRNNTKLVAFDQNAHQFTVLIPHFTFYSFTRVSKPKKQAVEDTKLANILVGPIKRSHFIDQRRQLSTNGSVQQNEIIPLTTAIFQAAASQQPQFKEEPTRISDIFDGLRDFIVNAEEKLYETETKLPSFRVEDRQEALAAQNNNRVLHRYAPYIPSVLNLPALQNFMFSAQGHLIELQNYPNHKKLNFISRQQTSSSKMSDFSPLFLVEYDLNAAEVARIVCNQDTQLRTRRFLSLYAVLFSQELFFRFDKRKDYCPVLSGRLAVDENSRLEFIKNWLAWASRISYGDKVTEYLPFKTKLMGSLALRKPILAQDSLIVNNCWSSAIILPSLQDQFLRQHLSEDNVEGFQPEITMILRQSVEDLKCSQWLTCLCLSAWYFKKNPFLDNLSDIVNSPLFISKITQDNGIEFKLFQLYLWSKGFKQNSPLIDNPKQSMKTLCYQWLLTNWLSLHQLQQKAWKQTQENGLFLFKHYNYQVANTIVTALAQTNQQLAKRIIECTQNLSEREVIALENVIEAGENRDKQKKWREVLKGNWIDAIDIGLNNFQNGEFDKDIYELVTHPQVLSTYKTTDRNKLQKILTKGHKQFADLLLILQFEEDETVGLNELRRLIEIYDGQTRFRNAIDPSTQGAIIAKLTTKLRYWIDRRKENFKALISDKQLSQRIKRLMQGTQIAQYFLLKSDNE